MAPGRQAMVPHTVLLILLYNIILIFYIRLNYELWSSRTEYEMI